MKLTSPSFDHQSAIPRRHTCERSDLSPALRITGVPRGSNALALIVEDPDAPDPRAPQRVWVHWVVYNLPPTTTEIGEGEDVPAGAQAGKNDWGKTGYRGPCPPIGRHRYFFKLYVLSEPLKDLDHPTKAQLERAMKGRVLASTELMATYEKGTGSLLPSDANFCFGIGEAF